VTFTHIDGSKVKMAKENIADETKDIQFNLLKKGRYITIRNAKSSIVKRHIIMDVEILGQNEDY